MERRPVEVIVIIAYPKYATGVWNIDLHECLINMVNVGTYIIYGFYGRKTISYLDLYI